MTRFDSTLHSPEVLLVPAWPAPSNVRAFVTTRRMPGNSRPPYDAFNLGLRSGESEEIVRGNRDLLVRSLGLPSPPRWLRQVHGANVVGFERPLPPFGHLPPQAGEGKGGDASANSRHAGEAKDGDGSAFFRYAGVGEGGDASANSRHAREGEGGDASVISRHAGEGEGGDASAFSRHAGEGRGDHESGLAAAQPVEPEADAAVTRERGVVLAILTADCLPVLLCAEDGSEIGAAHGGWRGLAAGVVEACVARMRTPPERLIAWLGPAIGPKSYEVGDEVRAAFVDRDAGDADAFAAARPGHWLCDLYTLARRRLAAAGVPGTFGGGFDTLADDRFYSYRRDGADSGRFASLIYITGAPGTA